MKNAQTLEERCESITYRVITFGSISPTITIPRGEYLRCTLIKGHKGLHLGPNDQTWAATTLAYFRKIDHE